MTEAGHLYEVVISNSRVWLKVQASCSSSEQSAAFFGFVSTETTTPPWTDISLSPLSGSPNAPITLLIGCQLRTGSQRDGTTTNSTLWELPIHGAAPCRPTAIATDRKGDWTLRIVLTSACTMRRISRQVSPRTFGTSTISRRWKKLLLAATSPEERRCSKASNARRPGTRPLSGRSLLNETQTKGY